jgi:hypothetical protein
MRKGGNLHAFFFDFLTLDLVINNDKRTSLLIVGIEKIELIDNESLSSSR